MCWTVLECIGLFWTVLDCVGLYCTVLDCTGLYRIGFDFDGLCWTVMDCTGLCWVVLGYFGLCLTVLNLVSFHRFFFYDLHRLSLSFLVIYARRKQMSVLLWYQIDPERHTIYLVVLFYWALEVQSFLAILWYSLEKCCNYLLLQYALGRQGSTDFRPSCTTQQVAVCPTAVTALYFCNSPSSIRKTALRCNSPSSIRKTTLCCNCTVLL